MNTNKTFYVLMNQWLDFLHIANEYGFGFSQSIDDAIRFDTEEKAIAFKQNHKLDDLHIDEWSD